MRLYCQEHGYMDEKTGPMAECPYCRIEELEEANKELEQQYSELYKHHVEGKHSGELADTEVMRERIEELEKEAQNYKNILIGQEFENLDSLATENRDTTQIGVAAKQRIEDIIKQRDELQAEAEQLRVQLAGCGVAAMCNTHESRKHQSAKMGDYGYSASYQGVLNAVGREIKYREEVQELEKEIKGWHENTGIRLGDKPYLFGCDMDKADLLVEVDTYKTRCSELQAENHKLRETLGEKP